MSDELAKRVFYSLIDDFRILMGTPNFAHGFVSAMQGGVQRFREYECPSLGEVPVTRFKAYKQLQHLFKKYLFDSELTDSKTLDTKTLEKFRAFQVERAVYKPFRASTIEVLREARKVIKGVLTQPYEPERYRRIGRRAEVRCGLKDAYFDNKLGPDHFSCPSQLYKDLFAEMRSDHLFKKIYSKIRKGPRKEQTVDHLKLVLVDKSWKIKRPITPLSTYGLYYSYGLGGYVEACLSDVGLDITRLQETHKRLAKSYSKTRSHVTADLSSASDSLRSDILNRLLPRWFYTDLRKTFCRSLMVDGVMQMTESVLPMGNGATFPVETLVFWSLIRAIGNLTKVVGVYSAYGDDLIYPRRIHRYVQAVFTDLGIKMNDDKTSVYSYFRESCGGDYYHGIDVRPAHFPSGRMSGVSRLRDLQFLYRVVNALLRRWSEFEIPKTLKVLKMEILALAGTIYFVPPSFPDTAGWRTDVVPKDWWLSPSKVIHQFKDGVCSMQLMYLGVKPTSKRLVKREDAYYWCSQPRTEVVKVWRDRDPKWGRYSCVGVNSVVAKIFLKDLAMREDRLSSATEKWVSTAAKYRSESMHGVHESGTPSGKPRTSLATIEYWA